MDDDADTVLVPRTPWPPSQAVAGAAGAWSTDRPASEDAEVIATDDTLIRAVSIRSDLTSDPPIYDLDDIDGVNGEMPQSGVYRYRLNDRPPTSLHRAAVIGRKPAAPQLIASGDVALVGVPSPLREVSASHLEIKQHGSSVVITDLNSTNGTRVTIPGAEQVGMRPGDSMVVIPGSVIEIGDSNLIEILPARLAFDQSTERLQP